MCHWRVQTEERENKLSIKMDRETSDHGHFAFLSDVKTTNSGKCQSNCHTFSPKVILGNFSGPYPYIHPFAQIQRPSFCFLCLSRCLWLFPCDIWGPCRVRLAWTDIFNSVSFGLRWSQLHVGLKADKLHTNCIRLPTCWKGKLLANLLRAADQLSGAAELLERSNWSAALRCAAVMRAREHLLDRLCLCPVDLVFSYVDAISVLSASAQWDLLFM